MNNPEKLATFGTQDTWQTQTKTKHNTEKRWAQRSSPKTALNPDAREKLAVLACYQQNLKRRIYASHYLHASCLRKECHVVKLKVYIWFRVIKYIYLCNITIPYYKKNRQIRITNESRSAYMWTSKGARGTPVSSTNKTDGHDIAEKLLKVALNIINQT